MNAKEIAEGLLEHDGLSDAPFFNDVKKLAQAHLDLLDKQEGMVLVPEEPTDMPDIKHLSKAIEILGQDNGISPLSAEKWPKFIDYVYLNHEASMLTSNELEILVAGEDTEQQKIMNKYGVYEFDMFLTLIFDGPMHDFYFCHSQS